jgi:hypothetical protein
LIRLFLLALLLDALTLFRESAMFVEKLVPPARNRAVFAQLADALRDPTFLRLSDETGCDAEAKSWLLLLYRPRCGFWRCWRRRIAVTATSTAAAAAATAAAATWSLIATATTTAVIPPAQAEASVLMIPACLTAASTFAKKGTSKSQTR